MLENKPENYNINAKICRLVEQYPCMYDRSHPSYLKKDVVDLAWIAISKEMNDSISSCKERWRNIRTSYARSINVNKVPASANRTKPYYLHEELQFLSRHITPGIPVSRRSVSNSYHTSPRSEKGEHIEVALGEESIDSYAAAMMDYEDKSQDREERSNSVTSESSTKKTTTENDAEPEVSIVEANSQQQQQSHMEERATSTTAPVSGDEFVPPPMVQIEEDHLDMTQEEKRDSINFACAPPKKRLRVANSAYGIDNYSYPDVKPVEIVPPHDYDNIFLQGLLPEMKAMDFRQKILFKRRIYEVLSEIFDNSSSQATSTTNSQHHHHHQQHFSTNTSPIAMVNSSDLNMLRRLNHLLQDPSASTSTTANNSTLQTPAPLTPRSVNISNGVLAASPNTPTTVPIAKIGATTRSSAANVTRLRMVSSGNGVLVGPPAAVKEEPDTN
ncbi:uncharacterized protein LOC133321368 [Musca vetustissima]|uniref:uncharacterized protein LOC133321368 n=1 Tax=Musca vetustissima TaxID=27455 RepID=UPI002AB7A063|nr:uncharacterized protein LOC133321368 [Musca vetustissima]